VTLKGGTPEAHFRRIFVSSLRSYRFSEVGFLQRDAVCKRGLCCRPVSVCLSVTFVHYIHIAKDVVKLLVRPSSHITLVFLTQRADTQFQEEPLQRGRIIQGGGEMLRFSTEISVYLGNG